MKVGTLFSGGGGFDIGARAAGAELAWGVEYDSAICDVYRQNLGDHVINERLQFVDPRTLSGVDLLHASPPCPNFSNVKRDARETQGDIDLANKVAEFIEVLQPKFFTLENVYQYRNSKSWALICKALHASGYKFDYWHLCAADYGVPQTRRRMIAIARRDGVKPMLPPATHAENPVPGLFGTESKWISWYSGATNILSSLQTWEPSKRVKNYLPCNMPDIALVNTKDTNFKSKPNIVFSKCKPSFSITSSHGLTGVAVYKHGDFYKSNIALQSHIQTFPSWYKFMCSDTLANRIIGNAVPPLLAQHIVESLV